MITAWLVVSLMFGAGGFVTFVTGRRLARQRQAALAWILQAVGLLLLLAGIVGIAGEYQ